MPDNMDRKRPIQVKIIGSTVDELLKTEQA